MNKKKLMLMSRLVIFCLVISCFMPWINFAKASQLTLVSDTMSRLKSSTLANHTIQFTSPSGVDAGETITIIFPAGFNLGSVDYTDIDLKDDEVNMTLAASPSGSTVGVGITATTITFTNGTSTIAASSVIKINIGTNATFGVTGDAQIINPSVVGTQVVRFAGSFGDTATLALVILDDDQVVVSATVAANLTFSIAPMATSTLLGGTNSATTDSVVAASTTTLPFGEQTVNQGVVLGQAVTVTSNGVNGYQVTVQQNQDLVSGSNNIDDFVGTNAAPQQWEAIYNPTSTVPSVDTGWFGYTTSDTSLSGGSARFGTGVNAADSWAGFSQSNTPYEIVYKDSVAIEAETTNVGFKLEANAYQPAGNYAGMILTYICTGLF
ncbi:MAG: hypothetical protein ABH818_01455 [Patescibacteria group bacterium]|nr:hypothetical protein [Patescibacteria group bacterium]MBU1870631.1 hypothetical protein [Patescibacteria group bacterium]